jgi:4-hydroxybenzoate polyprenyltransferase
METLGFVAIVVNLIVTLIKKEFGTETVATMLILMGLSVFSAILYFFVKDTTFFENLWQILTYSAVFYNFVQKPIDKINKKYQIL